MKKTQDPGLYNTFQLPVRLMIVLKISLGLITFVSANVSAQVVSNYNNRETATSEIAKIQGDVIEDPVEVGIGGDIRPERGYRTKAESAYEWHAHMFWESRYVTEGRDNLSGKSLVSLSTEFSIDGFSIVPWIADGVDTNYEEFNLNVIYANELTTSLVLYTGYNYIHSRPYGARDDDNEINLDFAYQWLKHISVFASVYYSFEAKGSFMETSIKHNGALNEKIRYSLQGILGVNAKYVSDGHNGLNHFQLRAQASYHSGRQIELYTFVGYNLAINPEPSKYVGDEQLKDFSWSGIGLTYLF